jgi:hypothetical protein
MHLLLVLQPPMQQIMVEKGGNEFEGYNPDTLLGNDTAGENGIKSTRKKAQGHPIIHADILLLFRSINSAANARV